MADLSGLVSSRRALDSLKAQISDAEQQYERDTTLMCARRFDESQTAGHRIYIGAAAQLQGAYEHYDALWSQLDHFGLRLRAPWTLLRAVFEGGFWAQWLLDPQNGWSRRRRGLHLEVQNHRQKQAWLRSLAANASEEKKLLASERSAEKVYKAECDALRLSWKDALSKPNVADEIHNLRTARSREPALARYTEATWRALSGFQHGLPYPLLVHTSTIVEAAIPGGTKVQLDVKDDAFVGTAMVAFGMLFDASQLYVRRSTQTN